MTTSISKETANTAPTTLALLYQFADSSPQVKDPSHVRIFRRVMALLLTLTTILMIMIPLVGIPSVSSLALYVASFLACCALLCAVTFLIVNSILKLPSEKKLEQEFISWHQTLEGSASSIEKKIS